MSKNPAPSFQDIIFELPSGLKLYARDYSHDDKPAILCLHGLTRNSADFEPLADYLAQDYRLIIPDQRGRGRSDYDPDPAHYRPDIYAADMLALLAHLGLSKTHIIGTSMGGIMAMIMHAVSPKLIQSCVLNDIGPQIEPEGLSYIKSYVGHDPVFDSWDEAAAAVAQSSAHIFPAYKPAEWMSFTRQLCKTDPRGIVFAYDPQIAAPFKQDDGAAPPDMWPLFEAMSSIPLLIIRGQNSNLFSQACYEKMLAIHLNATGCITANIGHAPMLNEPEPQAAITRFLQINAAHA